MPEIKQDIRGATFVVAVDDSLHKNMADYVCDGVTHELIIDTGEVAWNSRQGANVVCTADADRQVGSFSAKMAVQAAAGLGLLATIDFSALDLSDHLTIKLWIKHSLGCAAGDLALHLSATADCGGAPNEEEIALPILAAGVWTQIGIQLANPGSDTTIISVGIDLVANDPGAFDLFLDDTKQIWGDEVEIQAAIDALPAGGGKVVLLEGNYAINAQIGLRSGVTFQGQGSSTILTSSITALDVETITTPIAEIPFDHVTIKDLKIYGATGVEDQAIYIHQCHYYRIENVTIENFLDGISSDVADGGVVTGCRLLEIDRQAIYLNDLHAVISHNYLDTVGGHGINVENGTGVIEGNILHDVGLDGTSKHGIRMSAAGAYTMDWSVVGNQIHIVGGHAITIGGLDGGSTHRGSIVGNVIRNPGSGGIVCVENTDGLIVKGNYVFQPYAGIVLMGTFHVVEGNVIDDPVYAGIWIGGDGAATYCIVQGNIVYNGGAHNRGIYEGDTAGSDFNTIRDNHILSGATRLTIMGEHTLAFNKYCEIFMDVIAVTLDHVRNNEDLSAGIPITFTLDAQPDVPRTLSWVLVHANITEYDMEVVGIDAKGNTITETWDETAGWSGETSNAFAVITSIKMTARTGTGVADTMDIGITDVLGLSNVIYETGDVFKIKKNNADALVAVAQVDITYDTYDMSVIGLAVTDDFTIWYRSNLNRVS